MTLNSEFQNWESLPVTSYDVDQVAFSPDGKILASWKSCPEHIKLWDVVTGELLYKANYIDHVNELGYYPRLEKTLSFTPNGNALIFDGFILVLAQRNVVNVRGIQAPTDAYVEWDFAAISPDLKIGVSAYDSSPYNRIGQIKLWKTSTHEELHTYYLGNEETYNYRVRDIYINEFSPNGKIFASLIYILIESIEHQPIPHESHYETIKLWEVETGREIASILLPNIEAETKYKGVLAFSLDSRILASNCGETWRRIIVLIDTATGEELCRSEQGRRIVSLAFSPDNRFLASGDCYGEITLWEIKNDSLQSLNINPIRIFASNYKEAVKTLAFSPDGRTLVSGLGSYGSGITMWDVNTGRILKTFPGHLVSRRKLRSNFSHRDDIVISTDGNIIANTDNSDQKIKLWDLQTGAYLHCLEDSLESRFRFGLFFVQMAFSQDSNFLVGTFSNRYFRNFSEMFIWELATRKQNFRKFSKLIIWEVATGKQIQSIDFSKKNTETSLVLNQDGSLLVVFEVPEKLKKPRRMKVMQVSVDHNQHIISVEGATFIGKLKNFIRRLFNPKSPLISTLWTLSYKHGRYIFFSPDKRLVAILDNISMFEIREIATGTVINTINIGNSIGETAPLAVLFSPDGKLLVVSGEQNITFWNVNSGEQVYTINSPQISGSRCLAFSPDGIIFAFSENNRSYDLIKIWDIETNQEVDHYLIRPFYGPTKSLNFTRNGKFLISSYRDGTIEVWQRKL